jgi:hypothetical protein
MLKMMWKPKHFIPANAQAAGCLFAIIPFVAPIVSVFGEAACLNALFTGRPTSTNAGWAIAALIVMAAAIAAHALTAAAISSDNKNDPPTAERS